MDNPATVPLLPVKLSKVGWIRMIGNELPENNGITNKKKMT